MSTGPNNVQYFRNSVTSENLTWLNYFSHILLFQGFSPRNIHSLLDGSWSISIEVLFYISYAFVFSKRIKSSFDALWSYTGSMIGMSLFFLVVGLKLGEYRYYTIFYQLPPFMLGILCFYLEKERGFLLKNNSFATVIGLLFGIFFLGFLKAETAPLQIYHLYYILFTGILICANTNSKNILTRILLSFGEKSYSIFLVHILLLKALYTLVFATYPGISFSYRLTANFVSAFGMSWILSKFVFHKIDGYFVNAASRYINKTRQ